MSNIPNDAETTSTGAEWEDFGGLWRLDRDGDNRILHAVSDVYDVRIEGEDEDKLIACLQALLQNMEED